jgi:soluble lytic murein transglycosylase
MGFHPAAFCKKPAPPSVTATRSEARSAIPAAVPTPTTATATTTKAITSDSPKSAELLDSQTLAQDLIPIPKKLVVPTLPEDLSQLRQRFLQAETAFEKGQMAVYEKLKASLVHYPLYPYLLAAEYEKNIPSLSLGEFQDFMADHSDTPLAEQLRNLWLTARAKQEDWAGFLKAYIPTEDVSLQCQFLYAEYQTRQDKKVILEQTLPLWLSGKERPKSCEAVFKIWEQSSLMTRPIIWQRIKLAMLSGNIKLARYMKQFVRKEECALVELWITVHNNPYLITQEKYFTVKHPAILEIISQAVAKIAQTKPEAALKIWQNIGRQYDFKERHWGYVVREIALAFAVQKNPLAEKWLAEVPDVYANHAVHEWRMRIALAKEDWKNLLNWTSRLPETLANNEAWQYWQARALAKLNRHQESQSILNKVAQTRSYYGFLASQQLHKPYYFAHQKFALDANHLVTIARKKAIQRAKEFYSLGREAKAKTEWIFSTQRMNDKERHAAAALAIHWNLPNWSILALSKANNKNDLELRFPLVYYQSILKQAKQHQLDPAWIYAVTRQESAFIQNARSSAGALGLMQLMPGTAQLVAKKHQVHLGNHTAILEPHTNIQLGTQYLRMMLDTYENHPILATAAYNAGPGRVKKWLPNTGMSADSWIETIPFKETREYVKNVLTYTIIYQQLLGHKTQKPQPLPEIPANTVSSNMR